MYDCLGVYVCVCAKVGVRVWLVQFIRFLIHLELHGVFLGIPEEIKGGQSEVYQGG
jgi:hypothetical protein